MVRISRWVRLREAREIMMKTYDFHDWMKEKRGFDILWISSLEGTDKSVPTRFELNLISGGDLARAVTAVCADAFRTCRALAKVK